MKWAPLNVPLERRFQTLAVVGWMISLVVGGIFGWLVYALLILFFPILRLPLLLYVGWIYFDRKAGELGYRRSEWFRNVIWWKYLSDYFPVKLIKTADLSPDKNYLLATFPHGVLCFGAYSAFGSDYNGFEKIFPGLRSHILVLASHFHTPFVRELALSLGTRPSSASCIRHILSSEKKGEAVSLMVGGAKEAMQTRSGTYTMYVKNRKGFVKLALETGASIVPVITFGEPELFDLVHSSGTIIGRVQNFIKDITGIAPLIFNGRGIFQYSFGMLPRRHPLFVVVGKPIDVVKIGNPTSDDIESLHEKFVSSLQRLFEEEKIKYLGDSDAKLVIM